MTTRVAETDTAERMMTGVESSAEGLRVSFADGLVSIVPWKEIKEVQARSDVLSMEIDDPYELIVRTRDGRVSEIPWDFARHFGDPEHRKRSAETARQEQAVFAMRLRGLRCRSRLSRRDLAERSELDEATIERLETAALAPKIEVIRKLAAAMGLPIEELVTGGH